MKRAKLYSIFLFLGYICFFSPKVLSQEVVKDLSTPVTLKEDSVSIQESTKIPPVKKLSASKSIFRKELMGFYDHNSFDDLYRLRLRLEARPYITKDTYLRFRINLNTGNFIHIQDDSDDFMDTDFGFAFFDSSDITRVLPKKIGKVSFIGGLIETERLFERNYRVTVDQRGFGENNLALNPINTQLLGMRKVSDRIDISFGGEYQKKFDFYQTEIKAGVLASPGESINLFSTKNLYQSDSPKTFYSVMAKTNIPVSKNPAEFMVSHYYSFNDSHSHKNVWTVGGRLSKKFEDFGVLKAAVIETKGSTSVRFIGGKGEGQSYQIAFNPASKKFGNLFGDPDLIDNDIYNIIPGKTEFGFAVADYRNYKKEDVISFDVFCSRFFTKGFWMTMGYAYNNINKINNSAKNSHSFSIMAVLQF